MSLLAWIILGLVAGCVASKIVNKSGQGFVLDIVLGIVGAVAGGWVSHAFGMAGVTGLNLYSLMVAVAGAVLLLVAYHSRQGPPCAISGPRWAPIAPFPCGLASFPMWVGVIAVVGSALMLGAGLRGRKA